MEEHLQADKLDLDTCDATKECCLRLFFDINNRQLEKLAYIENGFNTKVRPILKMMIKVRQAIYISGAN